MADRVLIAPLMWLGNSHHHMDFQGTLSASPRVYLDLLNDLAENLRAQGRYREATPLFERSVTIAEEAAGPSHPELVTLLINLGGLYRDVNRYGASQ